MHKQVPTTQEVPSGDAPTKRTRLTRVTDSILALEFGGTFVSGSRRLENFIPKVRGEFKPRTPRKPPSMMVLGSYEFIPHVREEEDFVNHVDHEESETRDHEAAGCQEFNAADRAIDRAWARKRGYHFPVELSN